MHGRTLIAPLLAAFLLPAGCWNTANVGRGTPAEFNKLTGELHASVDRSLDESFEASRGAMEDMRYEVYFDALDALHGIVKAREADGGIIKVNTFRQAERVTTIDVDAGTLGSEAKARMIMEKILARLGH